MFAAAGENNYLKQMGFSKKNNSMLNESQNIEYKESWRDEYLKWICGFANAQGGRIYIGVDDQKQIVGIPDAKRLLEDIPNKVVNYLGIVVDVNLLSDNGKDYIEIIVVPCSVPISYRGAYHYRSGSTKQELKGVALQQFLLKKINLSWDGSPCLGATLADIDSNAVKLFVNMAVRTGRIPETCTFETTEQVLQRLHLFTNDGLLTMAAMLLFAVDIEKWCPTAAFRIGRFGRDSADLISSDSLAVPLIMLPSKVVETLRSRYLIAPIYYEDMQRIEVLEIPEVALREMLCNAIVHKDYQSTYIQMKVWDNRITLWNPGELPMGYTIDTLLADHESHPRNALIARVFYLAGLIETWGRGYCKIVNDFKKHELELPEFTLERGGFMVSVKRPAVYEYQNVGKMSETNVGDKFDIKLSERQKNIISIISSNPSTTAKQMSEILSVTSRTIERDLAALQKAGVICHEGAANAGRWIVLSTFKN